MKLIIVLLLFFSTSVLANPRIHNFAPHFLTFWEKARALGDREKLELFEKVIEPEFPEFYQYMRRKWTESGVIADQEILRYLSSFPEIENKFIEKTNTISLEITANTEVFLKNFPEFESDIDIYVIHSLGEMDGGVRIINEKPYIIFGVDSIVKYHNATNDIPFFHHELFHVYHAQYFRGGKELFNELWNEGMATFVSHELNPQSSLRDLMLDIPEGLVENCSSRLLEIVERFENKIDSVDFEDYRAFFLMGSKDPTVPKRAGYYLGYLVASEIRKTYTLDEMIRFSEAHIRREIIKALGIIKAKNNTSI